MEVGALITICIPHADRVEISDLNCSRSKSCDTFQLIAGSDALIDISPIQPIHLPSPNRLSGAL
jgi:hypothetical protein